MATSLQLAQGDDWLIGRVVLGRYRIVRELARGGMGVVYLARAEGAGGFMKPVVIKLVLPQHAEDARFLGMFVREAQILSDLRHPNIVGVLDFGQEGEAYVMVLEYINGYHLGQWRKFLQRKQRQAPADVVMLWAIDVLEALHKAHGMRHPDGTSMHIVHRDVSPSNILLDEDGRARLVDFGVARMRGSNVDYQTQIQSFVGKFSYGAPELLLGVDASPQSDLYSCAVVLHEMLLGKNTFLGAEDALTLARVSTHTAERIEPLLADAPPGLDAVLQKALSKQPETRYGSAWEFASALRGLLPRREEEVRARIVVMLRSDFGAELAKTLGVESLAERDQAWRHFSLEAESTNERTIMLELEGIDAQGAAVQENTDDSHIRSSQMGRRPRQVTLRNQAAVTTYRGPATTTGRLPIPEPPRPSSTQGQAQAAAPQPSAGNPLGWIIPVVVVTILVAVALWVTLRPMQEAPQAQRLIRIESQPDPMALAREKAALENARLEAQAAQRASILSAHQGEIDGCFARKGKLKGKQVISETELDFEVSASGAVTNVEVAQPELSKTPLARCLRAIGLSLRFPAGSEQSFSLSAHSSSAPATESIK
ncbi:MAG: protein kinase [Myxococcales bacterium]